MNAYRKVFTGLVTMCGGEGALLFLLTAACLSLHCGYLNYGCYGG